jgi:hypothetical protein
MFLGEALAPLRIAHNAATRDSDTPYCRATNRCEMPCRDGCDDGCVARPLRLGEKLSHIRSSAGF